MKLSPNDRGNHPADSCTLELKCPVATRGLTSALEQGGL